MLSVAQEERNNITDELRNMGVDVDSFLLVAPTNEQLVKMRDVLLRILSENRQ